MIKTRTRFVISVVSLSLAVMPVAQAGQMDSAMDSMFSAVTAPTSFSTARYQGMAFGSASFRTPVQSINMIAFDPPRFNGGCSGIDVTFGSFSLINMDQIKKLMRSIMAGAVGFAFTAAITAISSSLGINLKEWTERISGWNRDLRNTCAISKTLAGPVERFFGAKEETAKAVQTSSGESSDFFKALNELLNGNDGGAKNKYIGNLTFRALFESGADSLIGPGAGSSIYGMGGDATDLIINIVGTYITPTGASSTTCDKEPAGSQCQKETKPIIGQLNFDDLIQGTSFTSDPNGTTDAKKKIWSCGNDRATALSCLSPTEVPWVFEGTRSYVIKMLFGPGKTSANADADSIYRIIRSGQLRNLTASQRKFISAVTINLPGIVFETQHSDPDLRLILDKSVDLIAEDMAQHLMKAAIYATTKGYGNSAVHINEETLSRIRQINLQLENSYLGREGRLKVLMEIKSAMTQVRNAMPRKLAIVWKGIN